jgi:hypothetical protein
MVSLADISERNDQGITCQQSHFHLGTADARYIPLIYGESIFISGNINDYFAYDDWRLRPCTFLKEYLSTVLLAPLTLWLPTIGGRVYSTERGIGLFAISADIRLLSWNENVSICRVTGDTTKALSSSISSENPVQALELIDRFLNSVRVKNAKSPQSAAVIIDYAHFIVPQSETYTLLVISEVRS